MSEVYPDQSPARAIPRDRGAATALGAGDVLALAAAPTFAIMALLSGVLDGGQANALCAAMRGGSPLGGMVAMYVLMSAFHSTPWLKLLSGGFRADSARWRSPCGN